MTVYLHPYLFIFLVNEVGVAGIVAIVAVPNVLVEFVIPNLINGFLWNYARLYLHGAQFSKQVLEVAVNHQLRYRFSIFTRPVRTK